MAAWQLAAWWPNGHPARAKRWRQWPPCLRLVFKGVRKNSVALSWFATLWVSRLCIFLKKLSQYSYMRLRIALKSPLSNNNNKNRATSEHRVELSDDDMSERSRIPPHQQYVDSFRLPSLLLSTSGELMHPTTCPKRHLLRHPLGLTGAPFLTTVLGI